MEALLEKFLLAKRDAGYLILTVDQEEWVISNVQIRIQSDVVRFAV